MSLPENRFSRVPGTVTRPKIFLRLRPPLLEHEHGAPFCEVQDNTITYTSIIGKTAKREVEAKTRFDHIFPDTSSQADVFTRIWPEVQPFLDSGRTATIMMFDKTVEKYVVGLKFVQVYHKRVDDLLSGQKGVEIQSLADGGSKHVKQQQIKNIADFIQLYEEASSRRTTAANQVHDQSSRSHFMLQVTVRWRPKDSKSKHVSVLNLVDLAGSERYTLGPNPTKEQRLRSEESLEINKGLSFLSTVVDQLVKKAKTKDPKIAINFRDHNLTKLLASSLRGEGALCLVLCAPNVVPERDENVRTIRFGLTCLTLPVQPKRNLDTESTQVQELIHTQSRQQEDLDRDTALHVEGQAQLVVSEGELTEQPINPEQVEQVQSDLASVRLQRIEHDLNLAGEGHRNLVTLRFELEQGRKDLAAMSNTDKELLQAAEKRLEEREQEIQRLENYAGQLQEMVQDLSDRRDDYEQLRTALEAARQGSRERATAEQQRQAVLELEAKLEQKQREINDLTAGVERVFSEKQTMESSVSSFLQLLERRSTAERSLETAQQLASSLAERIRLAELSLEVDGAAQEQSEKESDELRAIMQDLNAELEDTEQQVNATQKLIHALSHQVDGYLAMLPPAEREIVRRYVQDFRQQAPTLHKLREEESHFEDELTRSDPSRSVGAASEVAKASGVSAHLATACVEADEEAGPAVGFDLNAELARIQTLQQNDELKRVMDALPESSAELRDFLSVYPSFVPKFVENRGFARIADLMRKTRHNSTRGNLSLVVVAALADPCVLADVIESGLVNSFREWLEGDEWSKCHEITISNALRAVKALAKSDVAKTEFRGLVVRTVYNCIMDSSVQDVVKTASSCLGELCPNVQQLQEACGEQTASELCGALVAHFYSGSEEVSKAAAECTAQLCNNSKKFKRMFMDKRGVSQIVQQRLVVNAAANAVMSTEMDCLDHAILRIDNANVQDAFALVLLSLILGCSDSDARERLQRVPDTAKAKVYEALAFFHATRVRDQDSIFVTSKSKEFPYQGRIFRGVWDAVGAGGDLEHTSYHRNPMYKLHVGHATHGVGSRASVSIVILHLDQRGKSHSLARARQAKRESWAFVDVVPRDKMQAHLASPWGRACGADDADGCDATALDEAQWQDGLKPIAFNLKTLSHRKAKGFKAAGTFDLEAGSDYVLIPHTDTRNVQGRFVLAVISEATIEVEKLSDEYSVFSFAGTMNSECDDFHLSSWRNGPQLSLSAPKDCLINVGCCYRDQDDELSELYLRTEEDRPLSAVQDDFKDRPKLQLMLAADDHRGTRRFVGRKPQYRYGTGCLRSTYFLRGGEFYTLAVSLSDESDENIQTRRLPLRVQIVSTGAVQAAPITESAEWFSFSSLFEMKSGVSKRIFELVAPDGSFDGGNVKHEIHLKISLCESKRALTAAASPGSESTNSHSDQASSSSDGEDNVEEDSTEDQNSSSEPRICSCTIEQQGKVIASKRYYMENEESELPVSVPDVSATEPLRITIKDDKGEACYTVFRICGYSTYTVLLQAVDEYGGALDASIRHLADPNCSNFIRRAVAPLSSRFLHDPALQPETVDIALAADEEQTQHSQKVWVDKSYLHQIYMKLTSLANQCASERAKHEAVVRDHTTSLDCKEDEYSELLQEKEKLNCEVLRLRNELQAAQLAAQMASSAGSRDLGSSPDKGLTTSSLERSLADSAGAAPSPVRIPSRPSSRASSTDRPVSRGSSQGRTPSPVTFPLRPSDRQHISPTHSAHSDDSSNAITFPLRPRSHRFLNHPPDVPDLGEPVSTPSKACVLQ